MGLRCRVLVSDSLSNIDILTDYNRGLNVFRLLYNPITLPADVYVRPIPGELNSIMLYSK